MSSHVFDAYVDSSPLKKQWLLSWAVAFLGFFFVTSSTSLFNWLVVTTYIFFLVGWDIRLSVFFSFWVSLLFRQFLIGTWIEVVKTNPSLGLSGFTYSFGLQPAYVWLTLLLLLILVKKRNFSLFKFQLTNIQMILLSFLCWGVVSSLLAPRLDLAGTGLISLMVGGLIFLLGSVFFKFQRVRQEFRHFILVGLLFLGLVGTAQYLLGHSLGIFIETRSTFNAVEFLTTDGARLYRVAGISPHPTFFASLLALFILPIVGLGADAFFQKKYSLLKLCFTVLSLGLIALVATFSRSSWVVVFSTVIVLLFGAFSDGVFSSKSLRLSVTGSLKKLWWLWLVLAIAGSGFIYQVLARLSSVTTFWSVGNWPGRVQLINHSWQMIKENPFVGVGLNHFPKVMVDQGVSPDYRGFIFPVHNTFLLFLSEMGVVGGGLFIFFVLLILVKTRLSLTSSWFDAGVWLALITFIINAQFHTLFNQDPSFNIFMLLSGYLVAKYENHRSSSHPSHRH